jgi:hypothetical protein
MAQNVKNIQLDLNNPLFQESWFQLESHDAERVRSSFERVNKLSWSEFYKSKGFRWEKVESIPGPSGVDALYSFRITISVRAVAYREGNFMRVLYIQPDHDATYGKK